MTLTDFMNMPVAMFEKMVTKQYDLKKKEYELFKNKGKNTTTYTK